jgi:hypothetical protein
MKFRAKLELARSKRIAHTDLHSQLNRLDAMGRFDKGEDVRFFADLQSFYDAPIVTSSMPLRHRL